MNGDEMRWGHTVVEIRDAILIPKVDSGAIIRRRSYDTPIGVADCSLICQANYTPPLFRRSRLKRFAPLARRFWVARSVFRETGNG